MIILPRAGTVIPPNGTDLEIFQDTDGSIKSLDSSGTKTSIGGSTPLSWWAQRQARAQAVLNYGVTQVDYPINFDYSTFTPAAAGVGYTYDSAESGTVLKLGAVGTNYMYDAPVDAGSMLAAIQAGAGATVASLTNLVSLIAVPAVEPWYLARRVKFMAAPAGAVLPVCLTNRAGTVFAQIVITNGSTHFSLQLANGAGTTTFDLGATCAIGSALAPLLTPFTIEMFFDVLAGTLSVGFQDTIVKVVDGVGGGLENMPGSAVQSVVQSADGSVAAIRNYGGFAMLKTPTA